MNTDFIDRWTAAMQAVKKLPAADREAIFAETLKLVNKIGSTTAICFIAVVEARL